jgi:hypothetical protein
LSYRKACADASPRRPSRLFEKHQKIRKKRGTAKPYYRCEGIYYNNGFPAVRQTGRAAHSPEEKGGYIMPYTFDATFERSNPIPALESSDPAFAAVRAAGKRLIDNEYKSDWFFALSELLKFRRNDPDPLRREHCIDLYDVQGALWIVDEDGSVTDAMAEFNEYFKQAVKNGDEDFLMEYQSPLTDKLIHASMEGRLYIRPLGERTFRQVQTAVKGPKAEELEFNLSVSTPVSKVLRPEIKAREITVEEMNASPIEPMPKPQKPNILKRIFAIFFRAELAQYERDMAVWQEHQTLEQLREMHDPWVDKMLDGYIDLLIDGEYVESLNDGKSLRGSSNQQVLFLTDRYLPDQKLYEGTTRNAEVQMTENQVFFIGIPGKETWEQWQSAIEGIDGTHGPREQKGAADSV